MAQQEFWIFLFIIGTLLFNWPFLDIFNLSLPYYLFAAWGIFILVITVFMRFVKKHEKDSNV